MCVVNTKLLAIIITLILLIQPALANKNDKITDATGNTFKTINNAPSNVKGNISVTDTSGSNYAISSTEDGSIIIKKYEKDGEHTKTKIRLKSSFVKSLKGYNGKKIAVANLVNGTIINYTEYDLKSTSSGGYVTLPATFSEVIVSGMTGWYVKTVSSVSPLDATINFHVENATGLYAQPGTVPSFVVWNETNISTYPRPSKWLFVWPLNGNANDISGNARHGTVANATSTAGRAGSLNTGYYFDGNNDFIKYDFPDTLYASNTLLLGYKLNHTVTDSDRVVTDFRDLTGVGRTGIYEYENSFYINNQTTVRTLNSTTNTGWNYAFYPFTSGQINYMWLGIRWNLQRDFIGWIDMAALFNGTLTANERRHIAMGYNGIKIKSNTGSFVPLTSTNQSISAGSSIEYVKLQSNNDTAIPFTLAAPFQQNYTVIRDWYISETTHRVDISFRPATNTSVGTLSYQVDNSYTHAQPSLTSNDPTATATLSGDTLTVNLGELTADSSYWYNVSFSLVPGTIESRNPSNSSQTMLIGDTRDFNISTFNTTDVDWYLNDSLIQSDDFTNFSNYEFNPSTQGSFLLEARVPHGTTNWTISVIPATVLGIESHSPVNLTTSVNRLLSKQFDVWITKNATVKWYINGSLAQEHDEFNISSPSMGKDSYTTQSSLETGTYNITAIATDGVTTDSISWTLTVLGKMPVYVLVALVPFFGTAFGYLRRRH